MRTTDGLEEKLSQLLNDPNAMAQVLSMAQAFGLQPDAQAAPEKPPVGHEPPPPPAPPPFQMPDERMMGAMFQLMQQAQQSDGKQEALLCALKPYLAPERQEKNRPRPANRPPFASCRLCHA